MNWRLAHSLEACRTQANAVAPHRSTASDGTIGDTSHAAGPSGHNPDANGVVTSFDLTQDVNGGMDAHKWIRLLVAQPTLIPDDLHYAISDHRIFNRDYNWLDRPYSGADPHTNHVHLSVGRGSDPTVGGGPVGQPYDGTPDWHFNLLQGEEDDMYTDADRKRDDNAAYATVQLILPAVGRIEAALHSNANSTVSQVDLDKIKAVVEAATPASVTQAVKDALKQGTG